MKKLTKLGMIWGAAIAGLVAIPFLFPLIFFISADNQTFAGATAAIVQCLFYEAIIMCGGALFGGLIGRVVSPFTKEDSPNDGQT